MEIFQWMSLLIEKTNLLAVALLKTAAVIKTCHI